MSRPLKLVIFDIDGTLFGDDIRFVRPHAYDVLNALAQKYELGIWSCGSRIPQAMAAIKENTGFDKWRVVLGVTDCYDYVTKDLSRVVDQTGYEPCEIAIVDDDVSTCYDNDKRGFKTFWVKEYALDDQSDYELIKVKYALLDENDGDDE